MARNDEGEFELVLGNRQLLSVFFIVIVLLGVFFTMGYIVGRNTVPQFAGQQNPVEVARNNPIVVEPAGGASPAVKQPDPTPPPVEKKQPEVKQPPPETKTAEAKKAAEKKPVETKVTPPKPPVETPTPPPVTATGGSPSAGTFLQVAATKKNEADLLVEVLGKKGFRATTSPVPGQGLLRVLVGPLAGDAIGKTRTDLEAIGFKPMIRRF